MSVFKNQTLLTITVPTGYEDISGATVTRIKYKKSNGKIGYFEATVSGTDLIYDVQDGNIDKEGLWWFQSYIEIGGKVGFGEIVTHFFEKPL